MTRPGCCALGLDTAAVVGHSGGASIACALAARYPDLVRAALIYEPPLLAVGSSGAEVVDEMRALIERSMAAGGPRGAMEAFIRANAGDEAYEEWHASTDAEARERLFDNAELFFAVELPAFAAFVPDREALRSSGVPLTVVVGEDNRDGWYGDAVRWLAEGANARFVEMSGGHASFETHRQDFVQLVRRVALEAPAGAKSAG